jgi:hypothetical protein
VTGRLILALAKCPPNDEKNNNGSETTTTEFFGSITRDERSEEIVHRNESLTDLAWNEQISDPSGVKTLCHSANSGKTTEKNQ